MSDLPEWGPPPAVCRLGGDEVHVYRVELDQPDALREVLSKALSPDERQRAASFHFDRDRHRFVVARGVLRRLLAGILGVPPEQLGFAYGPQGKPALACGPPADALCFNLSHSHDLALAAVAWERQVGVDVEQIRPTSDIEGIVRRYFSRGEASRFFSLPPAERDCAFFRCWTRKEAYLKASGEGFSRPLDGFDVTLAPGEEPRLLRVAGDPAEVERWTFSHLDPRPGFVGALAVERSGWRLQTWSWQPA